MIRPLTCLCMLLAGGSGLYLYQEKHRTSLLDREITRTIHASEAAHERTGLLKAEWALLNEPGRLQDLADRFLALHAMSPSQFVPVGELASRLPAVAAPPAASSGTDADPVVADARPTASLAFDATAARPDAARPVAAHPEPGQTGVAMAAAADAAHVDPAPHPAAAAARTVLAATETRSAAVAPAAQRPARVAQSEVRQERRAEPVAPAPVRSYAAAGAAGEYAPGRVMAPVLSALATPVAVHPQRAEPLVTRAAAMMPVRPAYVPSALAAPTPYSGSSLGTGRALLPPPVPMGVGAQ